MLAGKGIHLCPFHRQSPPAHVAVNKSSITTPKSYLDQGGRDWELKLRKNMLHLAFLPGEVLWPIQWRSRATAKLHQCDMFSWANVLC